MTLRTPEQWFACDFCSGSGVLAERITVYEHGCGFPHDDTHERPCDKCNGSGGYVADVEPDKKSGGPTIDDPTRPTCKPDGSCCDFVCGN